VNEYILYAARVLPKSHESLTWFTAYNYTVFRRKEIYFFFLLKGTASKSRFAFLSLFL